MRIEPDLGSMYYLEEFMKLRDNTPTVFDLSETKVAQFQKSLGVNLMEEFLAFRSHTGLPVTLVSCTSHSKIIPTFKGFYDFYAANSMFWLIPCETPESVIGFVLRGWNPIDRKHKYVSFQVRNGISMMFGFHKFSDFSSKNGSPFNDTPIVLVEGIKDALFIQRVYPYALAMLTNSLTDTTCQILSHLSRRIVLALDSDKYGMKAYKFMEKKLQTFGMNSFSMYIPGSLPIKDWGSAFVNDVNGICESRIKGTLSRLGVTLPVV